MFAISPRYLLIFYIVITLFCINCFRNLPPFLSTAQAQTEGDNIFLPFITRESQSQPSADLVELGMHVTTDATVSTDITAAQSCLALVAGQEFYVDLYVEQVRALDEAHVQLDYNAELLQLTALNADLFLAQQPGATIVTEHDDLPDQDGSFTVTIRDSSSADGESGSGTVARLTFMTLATGISPITFGMGGNGAPLAPILLDSDGHAIGDTDFNGQFDRPMHAAGVDIGGDCATRPDLLVVGFADEVDNEDRTAIMASAGVRVVDEAFADLNIYTVEIIAGQPLTTAQAALLQQPLVSFVEPVTKGERTQGNLPDDPEVNSPRAHRWDLINAGQTIRGQQGLIDADSDAHQAWSMMTDCTGAATAESPLVMAVIDSGLAVDHPDMAANVWTNPLNGTANDVLPGIDDVNGASFTVPSSGAQVVISGDVSDTEGHGTAVASSVAAVGDNGRELAGVCWSAQIVVIKVDLYAASLARALRYLLDLKSAGIDIRAVNASLARSTFSYLERAYIQRLGDAEILFFTGANNEGQPLNAPQQGIYRDLDNSNTVSHQDLRLTDVVPGGPGTIRYSAMSAATCAGDADCGQGLTAFGTRGKHLDPNGNGQYDPGESFYLDNDGNSEVSEGDTRWSLVSFPAAPPGREQFPPGSTVRCFTGALTAYDHPDCGEPLILFNANEKRVTGGGFRLPYQSYPCSYNLENIVCVGATDNQDKIWASSSVGKDVVDLLAPGVNIRVLDVVGGDVAEIYRDIDGDGRVSTGDIRTKEIKAGDATYARGSTVAASDTDVGGYLRAYATVVKYDDAGTNNGLYDQGEIIYRDNDEDDLVSIGDLRLNRLISGTVQVLAGHPDVGNALLDFATNEKYNSTRYISGTSFAAPHTAGMAMLCWAMMPDRTANEIKELLLRFVDRKAEFAPFVGSGGRLRWPCAFELGDAPVTYETIGSEGSPTELLLCSGGVPQGPIHLDPTNEHFGPFATQEHNANTVGFLDQEGNSNLGPGPSGTCVTILPDSDDKDDGGFSFDPPPPWIPNVPVKVSFKVCSPHIDGTAQVNDSAGGRYGTGGVYATAWFDWNGDGRFTDEYTPLEPNDEITELTLPATLDPAVPATTGCIDVTRTFLPVTGQPPWMRWRLDYGEHKGDNTPNLFARDPIRPMSDETGIAIYGEVEDHAFVYNPPRTPTKVVDKTLAAPGDQLHYTVTFYGNSGLTAPTAGRAFDQLSNHVDFAGNLQCSSGSCSYDAESHFITWEGDLTAESEVVIEYDVDIPLDYPEDWPPVENRVLIFDGVTTQQATATTQIECEDPGPIPTKRTTVNVVKPDAVYQYHINIPAKPSAPETRRVALLDTLPDLIQFEGNLSCQPRGITCQYDERTGSVQWSGDLGPDVTVDVTFDVVVPRSVVPDPCPAEIVNRVTIFDPTGNIIIGNTMPLDCAE